MFCSSTEIVGGPLLSALPVLENRNIAAVSNTTLTATNAQGNFYSVSSCLFSCSLNLSLTRPMMWESIACRADNNSMMQEAAALNGLEGHEQNGVWEFHLVGTSGSNVY